MSLVVLQTQLHAKVLKFGLLVVSGNLAELGPVVAVPHRLRLGDVVEVGVVQFGLFVVTASKAVGKVGVLFGQIGSVRLLQNLNLLDRALDPDPLKSRLLRVDRVALFNETERRENVSNVVESSHLRLQFLVFGLVALLLHFRPALLSLKLLTRGDLLGGFFEAEDGFPGDEQENELLAEDSKGLLLLVLFLLVPISAGHLLEEAGLLLVALDLHKGRHHDLRVD